MYYSIGKHLGVLLALFEYDSIRDPDDLETLQKIQLISEVYGNFSDPEYGNFRDDFQKGYEIGSADVRMRQEAECEEMMLMNARGKTPAKDDEPSLG